MRLRIVTAVALALLFVAPAFAQTMPMPSDRKSDAMPDCAAMMKQHEGMMKHMAEMDAKLSTLVDEMNKAKGSKKVDRMAAVINELVSQRSMMADEMMKMQPAMMEHMMEHMQSGMARSMADCPMMKEMKSATADREQKQ